MTINNIDVHFSGGKMMTSNAIGAMDFTLQGPCIWKKVHVKKVVLGWGKS